MGIIKLIRDRIQGKTSSVNKRSSSWPKIRKEWLKDHPACALCGGKKKIEVHHKVPFHVEQDLELNPNNLITLCEAKKGGVNCHLFLGHMGNYRAFNPDVQSDCERMSKKIFAAKNWNHLKTAEQKLMEKDL
jgi:5-methylcytosine-specific restriction enzyme A